MKGETSMIQEFVKWFEDLTIGDVPSVGGKNASLGEMIRNLGQKGVRVPSGFAITAYAYKYMIEKAGIDVKIQEILKDLDTHDVTDLGVRGQKIRTLIKNTPIPPELEEDIRRHYREMEFRYGENADVAVRSSATAEDLPDASFAGQQETYLNVRGEEELIEKVRDCFASLFTNRAISYRVDKGFDHFSVYLSVGVQKMVRSDLACSGVMFSIDTESGFTDAVYITGAYGLGENVVQGAVNPDQFYVFKPTLNKGFKPILEKKLGSKEKRLIYGQTGTKQTKVSPEDKAKFVINDEELLTLARWACIIEDHYKKPMDIEWAKDGQTGELFIVQARPETVHSQKNMAVMKTYVLDEKGTLLAEGEAVGSKIGQGQVNIIKDAKDISQFKTGQVLVTDMTDPDWEPIMKIAGAIVTNRGGRTCHAAIISRELGIPCVIGTGNGTEMIKNGSNITIDCSEGVGRIYNGLLKFHVDEIKLDQLPKTKTMIMMNVGVPEQAFQQGQIPNNGVGLAREEFIINSYIGIHPLALLDYDKLKKKAAKDKKIAEVIKKIDERSASYDNKVEFFIDNLARGISKIAAGFYPNDVIVRMSDFKSNEYANLIGGYLYEPVEHNPMIGWRGASRYYDEESAKRDGAYQH
jgi:pyruvate,water dikinase